MIRISRAKLISRTASRSLWPAMPLPNWTDGDRNWIKSGGEAKMGEVQEILIRPSQLGSGPGSNRRDLGGKRNGMGPDMIFVMEGK